MNHNHMPAGDIPLIDSAAELHELGYCPHCRAELAEILVCDLCGAVVCPACLTPVGRLPADILLLVKFWVFAGAVDLPPLATN